MRRCRRRPRPPGERGQAKEFVLDTLAGGLEVPTTEIKEAGEANGLSWRTIKRAKDELIKEGRPIKSRRIGANETENGSGS
jgi:hypothetical protein